MHVEWKTVTGNCLWCRTRVVSWLLAPLEEFGILATSVYVMEMGEWMGCNVLELSFRASGWGPLQTVHCQNVKNTILLNTVQDVNSLFTPPTRTRQDCLVLSVSAVWTQLQTRQFPISKSSVVLNIFETEQLQIRNWVETRQNCLVLSPIEFTPPTRTRRNMTVLSCPCRRCEQARYMEHIPIPLSVQLEQFCRKRTAFRNCGHYWLTTCIKYAFCRSHSLYLWTSFEWFVFIFPTSTLEMQRTECARKIVQWKNATNHLHNCTGWKMQRILYARKYVCWLSRFVPKRCHAKMYLK